MGHPWPLRLTSRKTRGKSRPRRQTPQGPEGAVRLFGAALLEPSHRRRVPWGRASRNL